MFREATGCPVQDIHDVSSVANQSWATPALEETCAVDRWCHSALHAPVGVASILCDRNMPAGVLCLLSAVSAGLCPGCASGYGFC